jgi:hypothetical protein
VLLVYLGLRWGDVFFLGFLFLLLAWLEVCGFNLLLFSPPSLSSLSPGVFTYKAPMGDILSWRAEKQLSSKAPPPPSL